MKFAPGWVLFTILPPKTDRSGANVCEAAIFTGDAPAVTALLPETEYGVIMPYQSRDLHGVMMLVSF
jgi:hypothetical protein